MEQFRKVKRATKNALNRKNRVSPSTGAIPRSRPLVFSSFFWYEKITKVFGFGYYQPDIESKALKLRQAHNILSSSGLLVTIILLIISLTIQWPLTKDMVKTANRLIPLFGFSLVSLKVFVLFFFNHAKIRNMLRILRTRYFPQTRLQQYVCATGAYYNKMRKISICYSVLILVGTFFYCVAPLMDLVYGLIIGKHREMIPIFDISLPFDQKQHPLYEIKYMFDMWIVFLAAAFFVVSDLFFWTFLYTLTMFNNNLATTVMQTGGNRFREEEAMQELYISIQRQEELIEFRETIRKIISPFLLPDLMAVILIGSLSWFMLWHGTLYQFNAYQIIRFSPVFVVIIVHCVLNFYFIEGSNDSLIAVSDAAYNSGWEVMSLSKEYGSLIEKLIGTPVLVKRFSTFGLGDVSWENFRTMPQTTYDFFGYFQGIFTNNH